MKLSNDIANDSLICSVKRRKLGIEKEHKKEKEELKSTNHFTSEVELNQRLSKCFVKLAQLSMTLAKMNQRK
jgi:hypothetical protein